MAATRYYKPELDVLRLFAFLFVFFNHRLQMAPINPTENYWGHHLSLVGVFGVPLFFFLSAFLITELLSKEQNQFGKIDIKSFYIRRMLRIWPLYFAFFFGIVILSIYTNYFSKPIPADAQLAFSLFSGNWYVTFNGWFNYPVSPLWSISVEEQLYIMLPLIMFYAGRRGLKVFAFIAFVAAYITIIYYAQKPAEDFSGQWTNSFVQFQFFAAGILLSTYLKGWQPKWNLLSRVVVFILALSCWLITSIICKVGAEGPLMSTVPQAVAGWFIMLIGVMLFFLSLYGINAKYIPSSLAYLGRISYGLYVFHVSMFWIVFISFKSVITTFSKAIGLYEWRDEVSFLIVLIATVLISMLSYKFFEKPFLKLKKKFTFIPSRD